ncbi:hypothetical protein A8C32_08975 [Flavivirga aquatica]|uniref:SusD/RagB family nutrient-binding outer membrane lipoprotein n=1 Tax=Flavivirga aquatica TaxID=1849968 RepID=A0A1E5SJK0_9FLAO|nr:SusD/RagB family nutrient-binding outer membrane lipoprotein [Flavivirga aquatica]OEJ99290.1 hypothetical protein A8C32_08975 [Flavivirga aquatica]
MKKIFIKSFVLTSLLAGLLIIHSCETLDLNVVEDPNAVSPGAADPDLFLNSIQITLSEIISGKEGGAEDGLSEFGMEPVRMLHGFGPSYRELNDPGDFADVWADSYSNALIDIKTMNVLAEEKGLYTHIAIGQIIESYIMMTLVDFFGDVPYSQALKGSELLLNPDVDSGASIYEAVDLLLLDAVSNLAKDETAAPAVDLYYNGSETSWRKLANTLRLKLHLQQKLVNKTASTAAINALISDDDLITSASRDFQFQYSTNAAAPDSRHPYFEKNYTGSPDSDFYMSNYYMSLLANNYSIADPRTRYYFYRQQSDFSAANVVTKDCVTQDRPTWYNANDSHCTVSDVNGFNGLWGRDHLDPDGIPPDDQLRTFPGIYPAGGDFDSDSFNNYSGAAAASAGLAGAGITPIMLSSFTNFMLAEAALTLNTTGNPVVYLEAGIRESISKVMNFGANVAGSSSTIPTSTDIETYITEVLAEYNGGSDEDKLKVIVEQYFIALWGNGIEAYNTYRRTGQPSDIQPSVELEDPGTFLRSNWYPSSAADNNQNITQKDGVEEPVFWDTHPAGFVD